MKKIYFKIKEMRKRLLFLTNNFNIESVEYFLDNFGAGRRKKNFSKGFTMIEMIVSVALFSAVILMTTGVFKSVIEGQRGAAGAQSVQEAMRYAFEVMSKEIRVAQKSNSDCQPGVEAAQYKVFNVDTSVNPGSDTFYFRNKNGQCVYYFLEDDAGVSRLKITRGGKSLFITPNEISISGLKFDFIDDEIGAFHSIQPVVTVKMVAEMAAGKIMHKHKIVMQTTISSRYYE